MAVVEIIPVEKNKEYELKIESVTNEAMGVAHIDGFCIFVKGAVTGDIVQALIIKVNKGYAVAKIVHIIEPSKYRCEIKCNSFSKCGGCQLMHINYDFQLKIKENIVNDAMKRIGNIEKSVDMIIPCENTTRYRNKMIFPFGKDKEGKVTCGFYRERSHDVIPLYDCHLGDIINAEIIEKTLHFAKKNNLSVYDENTNKGLLRRLFIRKGFHTGEVMVVLSVNSDKLVKANEYVRLLQEISPDIKSVILNINKKRTNNVLGDKNVLLYGNEVIYDYLCSLKYEISPYSFYQVNPEQTEKLYNTAIDFAKISKDDFVMDIYCGIGTISLYAAKYAKKVVGVEIVEEAIINARKNAVRNCLNNTEFYADDASSIVPKLLEKGEKPDIVILDPPRKGSDEKTLSSIINAMPKRIVYVSCNPSTLARDLKFLEQNGYKCKKITAVDLFPQTTHVETVVLLSRI